MKSTPYPVYNIFKSLVTIGKIKTTCIITFLTEDTWTGLVKAGVAVENRKSITFKHTQT
ncbi:hypothetical protein [Methanolobus psychrotolerans]|uniref:hypothetical protein n=1 Tax=Methanolobus psychrotolerans TaxID=1874706 RepID=UPI0013E9C09E|nr:hypothetical protein [Methanolobus psychrotolerans]